MDETMRESRNKVVTLFPHFFWQQLKATGSSACGQYHVSITDHTSCIWIWRKTFPLKVMPDFIRPSHAFNWSSSQRSQNSNGICTLFSSRVKVRHNSCFTAKPIWKTIFLQLLVQAFFPSIVRGRKQENTQLKRFSASLNARVRPNRKSKFIWIQIRYGHVENDGR